MSLQLDEYLQLRADGETVEVAAERSTIGIAEARLHEADIESGALVLPRARAPARTRDNQPKQEAFMLDGEDVTTSIRVNDGPEDPIDLEKDIDHPDNAEAKEAISGVVSRTGRSGTVAADQLRLYVERIERLEEERKGLADDIKDVYAEAKANGFDKNAMKQCVKLRRMETHKLQEAEAILHTYMDALGLNAFESSAALGLTV